MHSSIHESTWTSFSTPHTIYVYYFRILFYSSRDSNPLDIHGFKVSFDIAPCFCFGAPTLLGCKLSNSLMFYSDVQATKNKLYAEKKHIFKLENPLKTFKGYVFCRCQE